MILKENENIEVWEANLFKSIKEISDLDSQKRSWTGNNPEIVSSFTEVLGVLYDDFDFERYLVYYKSVKGKDYLLDLMSNLNRLILGFQSTGYKLEKEKEGVYQLLEHPSWVRITRVANEIMQVKNIER